MIALVIGATGLVGRALTEQLLDDGRFSKVKVFVRRASGIRHDKLEEQVVAFDQPQSWRKAVRGDVLFSSLGTTLKKAGSKEAQYEVDYTYQFRFAEAAAQNGVPVYVLVSSAGARPDARIFYSRMKGELERAVEALPFRYLHIIRPGILAGKRDETRIGERIGIGLASLLGKLPPLRDYRPVRGSTVAKAMINASFGREGRVNRYTLGEVFKLAEAGL